MKIIKNYKESSFEKKNLVLGHCYTCTTDDSVFHYEFEVIGTKACIRYDKDDHLLEVVEFFHKEHPYILEFYSLHRTFYRSFDSIVIFKLPISILQVSKLFLNQDYLKELKQYQSLEDIYIEVAIIEDEYVVLDGHHLLAIAKNEEMKMVNVYVGTPSSKTINSLYLAKEQNIKRIQDIPILSSNEYEEISLQLDSIL